MLKADHLVMKRCFAQISKQIGNLPEQFWGGTITDSKKEERANARDIVIGPGSREYKYWQLHRETVALVHRIMEVRHKETMALCYALFEERLGQHDAPEVSRAEVSANLSETEINAVLPEALALAEKLLPTQEWGLTRATRVDVAMNEVAKIAKQMIQQRAESAAAAV